MILNVAIVGGESADRIAFARRFIQCVPYVNSVFEVYVRKTPFNMEEVPSSTFSVNQLLCDAMMVNEAVRGLAHLYHPLNLIVHRDTPFDVVDLSIDREPHVTLCKELDAFCGVFPYDFVFKVGESVCEPRGGVLLELGPQEAAEVIGKVCEANGLGESSGDTA